LRIVRSTTWKDYPGAAVVDGICKDRQWLERVVNEWQGYRYEPGPLADQ
jgi:hypothetical protein